MNKKQESKDKNMVKQEIIGAKVEEEEEAKQVSRLMDKLEEDLSYYKFDEEEQKQEINAKKWTTDGRYFKKVKISTLALMKMVTHSTKGGNIEVMGLMQGKINGNELVVMDSFALPVEGTETRVNAQQEGYEYMVNYVMRSKKVGRLENVVGWYHSHPGYGCWLSGIDVATQALNQQFQEPFLAVVIDPVQTRLKGRVELGAFRTLEERFQSQVDTDQKQSEKGLKSTLVESAIIPRDKLQDFGVHCKKYYQLQVEYFKTDKQQKLMVELEKRNWAQTLLQSSTESTSQESNQLQIKKINNLAFNLSSLDCINGISSSSSGSSEDYDAEVIENARRSVETRALIESSAPVFFP